MLLMLEDDPDRIERFTRTLKRIDASLPLVIWHSARAMIREVGDVLPQARLISLDHDLEPWDGETEDPGEGVEVARFLAERPPVCPVLIHSSNRTRSDWMIGDLDLGGWSYRRVAPIGENWIEEYWHAVVKDFLRG